jgi:hypothetical protein
MRILNSAGCTPAYGGIFVVMALAWGYREPLPVNGNEMRDALALASSRTLLRRKEERAAD